MTYFMLKRHTHPIRTHWMRAQFVHDDAFSMLSRRGVRRRVDVIDAPILTLSCVFSPQKETRRRRRPLRCRTDKHTSYIDANNMYTCFLHCVSRERRGAPAQRAPAPCSTLFRTYQRCLEQQAVAQREAASVTQRQVVPPLCAVHEARLLRWCIP